MNPVWRQLLSRGGRPDGPVRIGFIYPDRGPLAQAGSDMRDGFLLFWEEARHTATGRAVDILLETKATNNAEEGLKKAQKLVEADRVHLVGGIVSTAVAYVLRAYLVEHEIPTVIMNAGADGLTQAHRSKYIFRSCFSNSDASHPLGEWAYVRGYRRMVLIGSDHRGGHEQVGGIARTFTKAGGQILQELYPPRGIRDFRRCLAQIRSDADVAAVFFAGTDAIEFVRQYAEVGLKDRLPLIGKGHLIDDTILPQQGESAVGIVTALHWSSALDTPANRRFLQAYLARYQRPAGAYAEQGYVGACMIAQALETVKGSVEHRRAFLRALEAVEIDAPRGKVTLDAYHNPVHTIYICRVDACWPGYQNTPIANYPNTSQFWKWSPEAYLALPAYIDLRGRWAIEGSRITPLRSADPSLRFVRAQPELPESQGEHRGARRPLGI